MRIAVVLKDRCQPKKCQTECIRFCPRVRSGERTVVQDEKGKAIVSEELCVGCGICVHKCPFGALKIIGLPEALKDDWAMTGAIEGGDGGEAVRQLALMLDAGAPPAQVLGQLGWLVRTKFPVVAPAHLPAAVAALFRTDLDLKR